MDRRLQSVERNGDDDRTEHFLASNAHGVVDVLQKGGRDEITARLCLTGLSRNDLCTFASTFTN
jgi:hypothetical protein